MAWEDVMETRETQSLRNISKVFPVETKVKKRVDLSKTDFR